jgi:hypothetical protein
MKSFTNLKVLRASRNLTHDTLVGGPLSLFVSHSIIQSLEGNSTASTSTTRSGPAHLERINKVRNENQDDEVMVLKQTQTLCYPTLADVDKFRDSLIPVFHQMSSKQDETLKALVEESLGDFDVGMKSALKLIAESMSKEILSALREWYVAMIPIRDDLNAQAKEGEATERETV